jgi:hypothetical protein
MPVTVLAAAKAVAIEKIVPVGTDAILWAFQKKKPAGAGWCCAHKGHEKSPARFPRMGLLGWLSPKSVGYLFAQIEKR